MKRRLAICLCGAAALSLTAGCGSKLDVEKNTISLQKNGAVLEAAVEDFTEAYYDEDELTSFINDAVNSYTAENGEKTVEMTDSSVEEGTAYLTLRYDSCETFAEFTDTECFSGSVLEAQTEGYEFDTDFYAVTDGTAAEGIVSKEDVLSDDEMKVLIVRENVDIIVPGTIAYVSSDQTQVTGKDSVSVKEKENDTDQSVLVYVLYK